MCEHLFDNATVEIYNHGHREDVATSEYTGHEQFSVESIGQVIERA